MNLSTEFYLNIVIYVLGLFLAIVRVSYMLGKLETTFISKDQFEGFKKFCHESFVRSDICNKEHTHDKEDRDRIERQNIDARHELASKIQTLILKYDNLSDKMDELKQMIVTLQARADK
jgi:hypothetical protein